jgi:hypothetical protein
MLFAPSSMGIPHYSITDPSVVVLREFPNGFYRLAEFLVEHPPLVGLEEDLVCTQANKRERRNLYDTEGRERLVCFKLM